MLRHHPTADPDASNASRPAWYRQLSPTNALVQNLVVWAVVTVLLVHVVQDVSPKEVRRALEHSNFAIFASVNVAAVMLRWLADTYLYSLLFSYFHERTSYREVLPASTAQYFLQAVNIVVSDGAMVVFLHRRKGVPWVTASWTMAYQGLIDAIVMSAAMVCAGLLVPDSPSRVVLPYAVAALGFFVGVAGWWMRGRSATAIGQWLRGRAGMRAFRMARPHHYLVLGGVRLAIMIASALLFYVELRAFGLALPLRPVLALSPALIFAQNTPIAPAGLGTLQVVMVWGLSRYAKRDVIVTAALGISIVQLLCRIPLGIGMAGSFARNVLGVASAPRGRVVGQSAR